MAFTSAFCYRGESGCHATRRYHGPEGDLYLYRCDITIIALKVTVMTPVHFGPAIRMVLTFSFPMEIRAPGTSLRNGRKLWALRSFRACTPHAVAANYVERV